MMAIQMPDAEKEKSAKEEKKAPETKGTEMVPVSDKSLQKMQFSSDEFKELYQKEIVASMNGVTARLPQIKISRETGQYIFPKDSDGNDILKKDFTGIILHSQLTKAYWEEQFSGDGKPPTCASLNAMNPTQWEGDKPVAEKCATCPMNKFGSGEDSQGNKTKGKACRDLRRIHVLIENGTLLPYRLTLPPTSLANYDDYVTSLVANNTPVMAVITKFMTEQGDSGGFKVSKFKGEQVSFIAGSQAEFEEKFLDLKKEKDRYAPVMAGQAIESEEYEIVETNGVPTEEQPPVMEEDEAPF